LFFFSSRRRHTSFSRDWSLDVCSSDLEVFLARVLRGELLVGEEDVGAERLDGLLELAALDVPDDLLLALDRAVGVLARGVVPDRSEERRVGKTTIATWS